MSLDPEDDLLAAEYALGVLDPAERATIAARRQREPTLDAAIAAWERRLAPLAEAAPPIPARRDFLPDIEARIRARDSGGQKQLRVAPAAAGGDSVARLKLRVTRWRTSAIAASTVAVLVLAGAVAREVTRPVVPHEFVAVLQKSPDAPAFAVSVNIDTREFTVRPVAAEAPAGKAYELWLIDAKLGEPRSLGLIDAAAITRANRLNAYAPEIVESATYAVTVEPPGGSPNGKPSGTPVFYGKLIPVGP